MTVLALFLEVFFLNPVQKEFFPLILVLPSFLKSCLAVHWIPQNHQSLSNFFLRLESRQNVLHYAATYEPSFLSRILGSTEYRPSRINSSVAALSSWRSFSENSKDSDEILCFLAWFTNSICSDNTLW